ncbi:hypothetical protein B0A48_14893 [Cryoendolithus antarcticus]|uniref:Protein ecm33 n=1 Tax=Cryoendolithus antarcticus TaxID=1507870 RepID=A0A1V8SIS3_9PEZI|nr:hypothetical protein B0A48_14893 [Cryoendolithus antarcticus]
MSVFRYVVPALAIAGRAAAQCSASATQTIQNAGDAAALAGCQTFTGSIALATGTTGVIALNGIQEITGDLVADNVTSVTQLSGDSLTTLGGDFILNGMTVLTTLSFPRLATAKNINWVALPQLQGLSFTTGLQQTQSLLIENTQLGSLSGINLQTAASVMISNNPYLQEVNMQLGNISNALAIEANGRNIAVTFPNLEWAFNITLRNVSAISMPSLAAVNGSLGFYSNFFESVNAPNLTTVGQSLSFVSNQKLNNASFPQLTSVGGGLQIANNTNIEKIDGFPKLQTVGGALDFYGNFSDVALPSLMDVRGAFNLQSSKDLTNTCNHFQPLSGQNNVIKGTYSCSGGESTPGGSGTLPSGTNSGSGTSGSTTSSSASTAVTITGATGLLGVVAAIFGML